jgi:hypothetical protein
MRLAADKNKLLGPGLRYDSSQTEQEFLHIFSPEDGNKTNFSNAVFPIQINRTMDRVEVNSRKGCVAPSPDSFKLTLNSSYFVGTAMYVRILLREVISCPDKQLSTFQGRSCPMELEDR